MKKLKIKLPSLVGYADRPLLRGLATPRAAGLDLDKGGASIYALKSKSGVLLTSKSGVFLTPKGA
jgi:hypothetical protein